VDLAILAITEESGGVFALAVDADNGRYSQLACQLVKSQVCK